ncbi:MAG TPA: hypothetical protein VGI60_04975 [Chthoniobacterales bacterium]
MSQRSAGKSDRAHRKSEFALRAADAHAAGVDARLTKFTRHSCTFAGASAPGGKSGIFFT